MPDQLNALARFGASYAVGVVLIASAVCALATLTILSCEADPSDSGGGTSHDASSSSVAPVAAAPDSGPSIVVGGPPPTPAATPPASEPFNGRPVSSSPPDTTDYSRPARPGDKKP